MSYETINSKASRWLRYLGTIAGSSLPLPFVIPFFSFLYLTNNFMTLVLAVSLSSSAHFIFIFSTLV
ncbi:hypothetical protein V8C34DRAFT_28257 [Trichoderma compactum]